MESRNLGLLPGKVQFLDLDFSPSTFGWGEFLNCQFINIRILWHTPPTVPLESWWLEGGMNYKSFSSVTSVSVHLNFQIALECLLAVSPLRVFVCLFFFHASNYVLLLFPYPIILVFQMNGKVVHRGWMVMALAERSHPDLKPVSSGMKFAIVWNSKYQIISNFQVQSKYCVFFFLHLVTCIWQIFIMYLL